MSVCCTALCRGYHREKRERGMSPYRRPYRERDNALYPSDDAHGFVQSVGAYARHSPLEHWDHMEPDIPPPKTPSASPGREELVDYYPVAPPPAEAVYDRPPPYDAVSDRRQNIVEDVSSGPDHLSTLPAREDPGRKTEKFEIIAPAFPAVESSAADAPSQNDIQAILDQAHGSSKATVSAQSLRRKKLKEDQSKITQEEKTPIAATHDHVSRPSITSRLKNFPASSIILNEGLQSSTKSGTAGLTVSSGKYVRSAPISSGDDSEEVDVDTIADDLSTLPISIPLHHLPASQSEVASKSSLAMGSLTASAGTITLLDSLPSDPMSKPSAKKKKKKKKDRKKKDEEESTNVLARAQTEVGGGIKMKINLKKQESSLKL